MAERRRSVGAVRDGRGFRVRSVNVNLSSTSQLSSGPLAVLLVLCLARAN